MSVRLGELPKERGACPLFLEPGHGELVDLLAGHLSLVDQVEVLVDSLATLELGTELVGSIEISRVNFWVSSPVVSLVTVGEDSVVSDVRLGVGKVTRRVTKCFPAVLWHKVLFDS